MSATLADKEAVLREMGDHAAVAALAAALPDQFVNARWDRSEMTLTIAAEEIAAAGRVVQAAGYNFLEDVTAVDWYPSEPRFQLSYHIVSHSRKERIRLRVMLPGVDPRIESMMSVWPSANYYEREVFDLFGIVFTGHPNLRRILMPDDWQGHPLRKDYPVEGYR